MKIAQKLSSLMLVGLLAIALPLAATGHEATKGPNGGALVDVEGHHVEFVSAPGDVTFYLTGDKDTPISSAGSKAKAIVQDNGKTAQVDLSAAEPNKLVGKLGAPLSSGAKVVVTGVLADGHSLQARFVVP